MKILADFHHLGLFHSLQLLFEKRLGFELYRPIGIEWNEEGFWHVYDHPDTAKQYLMDGFIPKDGTPPLNGVSRLENGIHFIKDTTHNTEHRAITLEQFKETKFDIIIASIPAHIEPFKKLISQYQPDAKFVFQMGNMFTEVLNNLHTIPNLLSSTKVIDVPPSCNAVFYHQEFDTNLFKPTDIPPEKRIASYINLLPQTMHAPKFYTLKQELHEYDFKSHGILCDDGIVSGLDLIAAGMKRSQWGFHAKYMGDGFGHILYNWFASGKPVIICKSDYADKLGGELLEDETTCIDLDNHVMQESIELIRKYSQDPYYTYLSQQAYGRFKQCVDYDAEELKIREWVGRLR